MVTRDVSDRIDPNRPATQLGNASCVSERVAAAELRLVKLLAAQVARDLWNAAEAGGLTRVCKPCNSTPSDTSDDDDRS